MKRRDVLRTLVFFGVGSLINPAHIWMSCSPKVDRDIMDEGQIVLLGEIAETILPRHKGLPGAKDARVAQFIDQHIADCYTRQERLDLIQCIITIDETAKVRFKKSFVRLGAKQRFELLQAFDRAAKANKDKENIAYTNYSKLRSLIVFGFFTSEPGMKKCLRYAAIPGKYSGQIAYKKGDKIWEFN